MSFTALSGSATSRTRWLRAGIIAAVAAAVTNAIVYLAATGLLNVPLSIPTRPGAAELNPLRLWQVVFISAMPAVVAAGLLVALNRFTARPLLVFQIIAVIVLLLSLGPILALPIGATAQVVLALMHVVAAAIIVGVLTNQVH